jgi:hypothetical protein
MLRASMRCLAGAALLSAIVGGIAYAQAENNFKSREAAFQQLAQDACLANTPSSINSETQEDIVGRIQRLQALHRVCHYASTGQFES